MGRNFDDKLYTTEEETAKYLEILTGAVKRQGAEVRPELLTNYINGILNAKLASINNKCVTCIKQSVCKIWERLILEVRGDLLEKDPAVNFSVGITQCKDYIKKGM